MPFIKNVAIFARKVVASVPVDFTILEAGGIFASTAQNQSLFISGSGRAWAWGSGNNGQLGDNAFGVIRATPISILGTAKTFCQISAGEGHSVAIDRNGRVWGWGSNNNGQLGDNSTSVRATPVSIFSAATRTFCKISAGQNFTTAIDRNGRAWGWGFNSTGQLGNNSTAQVTIPTSVLGAIKTFCHISSGGEHTLAIDRNGRAWSWGRNSNAQLGDASITSRLTPVSVAGGVKTFCRIDAGNIHNLAIDRNGRLWAWGNNGNGRLGDNSIMERPTPVSVLGTVKTFCKISAGGNYSLAIDKNGRAWAWGLNQDGNLGDNTLSSRLTPVSVGGAVKTFCHISAGGGHSLAVDRNGRVWGWGINSGGVLGNNFIVSSSTPRAVYGTRTFCQIGVRSGFNLFTTAIDRNGRVWGWGSNNNGQLGNSSVTSERTPVSILGAVKTFCKISQGGNNVSAIDRTGRAWSWGVNNRGQLGNGDFTLSSQRTPVSVQGTRTFCEISCGNTHVLAIDRNGRVWAWGEGSDGRLGENSTISRTQPTPVAGLLKTFCKITGGVPFSAAIDNRGHVWTWGWNVYGGLGDNSTVSKLTPVSILGGRKTFCHISAGFGHTVGITVQGRAWAWGYNNIGQLGNNSYSDALTPVSVAGVVKTFCKIAAGYDHTMAIDKNGRAWGWGSAGSGQLGNNSTFAVATPLSVAGVVKTFCDIYAGFEFTLAIDRNGRSWGWGRNDSGQLGVSVRVLTPVQVCRL